MAVTKRKQHGIRPLLSRVLLLRKLRIRSWHKAVRRAWSCRLGVKAVWRRVGIFPRTLCQRPVIGVSCVWLKPKKQTPAHAFYFSIQRRIIHGP